MMMRSTTLGVYGWLLVAMALAALSAPGGITGGIAQAQQLGPPASGELNPFQLNPFQKEPLFLNPFPKEPPFLNPFTKEPLYPKQLRFPEQPFRGWPEPGPELPSPPASDWLISPPATDWLTSVNWSLSLLADDGPSPGKKWPAGDYWKPGEFDRLIGR